MDNRKLAEILEEAKETIQTMQDNIENFECLKFFSGKLSLLSKTIFNTINSSN